MVSSKFLDYILFCDNLNNISFDGKFIINTINPFSFLMAEKDVIFNQALKRSEILLPDGEGIVWAMKYLYNKKIDKIAGYDIFKFLMERLNKNAGSCYFFGSSESTLIKIKEKLKNEYPSINSEYFSPPFKDEFTLEENKKFVELINAKNPDVLFVGMTAPKQEKWVHINKNKINVPIIVSIGAVFDFYAGNVKRPGKFWIDLGLEWFIRLLQEPKRLWKRNFIYTPKFIFFVIRAKLIKKNL